MVIKLKKYSTDSSANRLFIGISFISVLESGLNENNNIKIFYKHYENNKLLSKISQQYFKYVVYSNISDVFSKLSVPIFSFFFLIFLENLHDNMIKMQISF